MKKPWPVFAVFFLSGCAGTTATMEEFQGMSSHERTKYICENHAEVKYHSYMADGNFAAMKRHEATPEEERNTGFEECSSFSDGNFSAGVCVTQPGSFMFHKGYYEEHSQLLTEKLAECEEDVQDLGVEEAFKYYKKVEGGHHWDTMREMFIEEGG